MKYLKLSTTMGLSVFIVLISGTLAFAQDAGKRQIYDRYATVSTEIAGISTFMEPPANFNALIASDEELAIYGFPPRPNETTNPRGYKSWVALVKASKFRWRGPLKLTNRQIGTASSAEGAKAPAVVHPAAAAAQAVVDHQLTLQNPSWSGIANIKNIKEYSSKANGSSSFQAVEAMFNVPVVEDAYGVSGCSALGAAGDAIVEVGIGGVVNYQGLLSGGIVAGGVWASNPGWIDFGGCSVLSPTYYAEINSPASPDIIQEFSVNPGDVIAVQVWDTSATTGYVFIADLTSFAYATYQLTWGSGFIGNAAHYIVWRPWSSGVLDQLANYTGVFWADANAEDFDNKVYGPATNSNSTTFFEMTDDAGDQVISEPVPYSQSLTEASLGLDAIYFYAENCAANYGCTP